MISLKFIVLCFIIFESHAGLATENFTNLKANSSDIEFDHCAQSNDISVFEVLAEPKEITIQKGSSGTIDLTINREDIFTGPVNLSIFPSPGLPANVNAPFSPSSVPGNSSSSVLTLEIDELATSGTYNVVIAGTGSLDGTTRLRTVSISLTIEDVTPAGVVSSFNFLEGNNTINGLSSINNDITLDVADLPEIINFSANTSGAVTAVEWSFKELGSGDNIQTYTDNSTPYTLYPSGGWTVSTGEYELEAFQINNTEKGDAKRIKITIESAPPPSFNIVANPTSLTLIQGESKSAVITLSPVNNFSGQVDLITDDLPEGVDGFFSVTTLNSEGTSNLRFEIDERAPVGRYSVRVEANGPNQLSSSTIIELNINRASSADFELIVDRSNLNIIRGEEGRVKLTIKPLNRFSQVVNFEAVASDNLVDFEFNPAEIANGNGTTELSVFTNEEIELGSLEISVTAISDTIEKTVELAVMIDPIPVELKPKNQFSPNGDGIDDVWVIEQILELPDNSVVVFDQAGREVFKAQSYKNDWDGKNLNGKDLQPTTYFFVVKDGGGVTLKTGSINLLR